MERYGATKPYRPPATVQYEEDDDPSPDPRTTLSPPTVSPSPAPGQLPPRHPVLAERDSPRRGRLARRSPGLCAACGVPVEPVEPFVPVTCLSGSVKVAHLACIRCPCAECSATIHTPVPLAATKFAAAPDTAQTGLWPFTEHIPVTIDHVRAFVERNRLVIEQHPAYDHPSGTATTRRPSTVKRL